MNEKYYRTPAPDDWGFCIYERLPEGKRKIAGRCFVKTEGPAWSDFYGPGSPLIMVGEVDSPAITQYWIYEGALKKEPQTGQYVNTITTRGVSALEFMDHFGISNDREDKNNPDYCDKETVVVI